MCAGIFPFPKTPWLSVLCPRDLQSLFAGLPIFGSPNCGNSASKYFQPENTSPGMFPIGMCVHNPRRCSHTHTHTTLRQQNYKWTHTIAAPTVASPHTTTHCTADCSRNFRKFNQMNSMRPSCLHLIRQATTMQRKTLSGGRRHLPHIPLRQLQVLGQRLLLGGGTQPQARVGLFCGVLSWVWVEVPGANSKDYDPKQSLPYSPTCIHAMSPPTKVTQESSNETGLNTGTSEVSSNALFFFYSFPSGLRTVQSCSDLSANPLRGPWGKNCAGLRASCPSAPCHQIYCSVPKHWTRQGSV